MFNYLLHYQLARIIGLNNMEDSTDSASDLSVLSRTLSRFATHDAGSNPPPSPPPPKKRKMLKKRRSLTNKAYDVHKWLREQDLSLYDVLAYCQKLDRQNKAGGRSQWRNLLRKLHRPDDPLLLALNEEWGAGEVHNGSRSQQRRSALRRLEFGASHLRREISLLADKMEIFGSWDPSKPADFMDGSLQDALDQIKLTAPNFYRVIEVILKPLRSEGKEKQHRVARMECLVPLCAMLCYGQQRNNASAFQKGMAMYLHSNGTKQLVMEVLHKFNICVGRSVTQRLLKEDKERGKDKIRSIGRRANTVIHYDNLEQLQKVRNQRLENLDNFLSVTTGYVVQGLRMKTQGLRSNMMDYDKPLRLHHVLDHPGLKFNSPKMREVSCCYTSFFIY